MARVARAAFVRATVSRAVSPRFIGPRATSSKTDPATPDSWVAGFWKQMPTAVAISWSGRPVVDRPSISTWPVDSSPPIDPGASPDATEVYQEGIIIPVTKLADQGKVNEAALAIFHRNSRFPEQSNGDMRALPGQYESAGAVLGAVQNIVTYHRPDNYVQTFKHRVEAQKDADIQAAAKEIVHPDELTWVIVGDRKQIEQPVRALNLGAVQVLDAEGNVVH